MFASSNNENEQNSSSKFPHDIATYMNERGG
jgi:hypothetical protein